MGVIAYYIKPSDNSYPMECSGFRVFSASHARDWAIQEAAQRGFNADPWKASKVFALHSDDRNWYDECGRIANEE